MGHAKRVRRSAPAHFRAATAAWFEHVCEGYELEEHHLRLLTLAAEAWDRCEQAREGLADGLTFDNRFGAPHPQPEVTIERDSRTAFARLVRELDLDVEAPPSNRRPPSGATGGSHARQTPRLEATRGSAGGGRPVACRGGLRRPVVLRADAGPARRAVGRALRGRAADWIEAHPGTRHGSSWCYDAPRHTVPCLAGMFDDEVLAEPRRRLGSTGIPLSECSAYGAEYVAGIPARWYLPGQDWNRGEPIDPNDPPRFEAQATYLITHGLLLPDERARLTELEYEPESVEID